MGDVTRRLLNARRGGVYRVARPPTDLERSARAAGLSFHRIDLGGAAGPTALPQIKTGAVRALATLGAARAAALPDLPSAAEVGYPNLDCGTWSAFVFPKGTPEPIVRKLEKVFLEICKMPEVTEGQRKEGFEPTAIGVDESKAIIANMIPIYRQVLADLKKK